MAEFLRLMPRPTSVKLRSGLPVAGSEIVGVGQYHTHGSSARSNTVVLLKDGSTKGLVASEQEPEVKEWFDFAAQFIQHKEFSSREAPLAQNWVKYLPAGVISKKGLVYEGLPVTVAPGYYLKHTVELVEKKKGRVPDPVCGTCGGPLVSHRCPKPDCYGRTVLGGVMPAWYVKPKEWTVTVKELCDANGLACEELERGDAFANERWWNS